MKKFILIAISVMTFFALGITSLAADFPKFTPQLGYDYIELQKTNGTYIVYTWESGILSKDVKCKSGNSLVFMGNGTLHRYTYNPTREYWSIDSDYEQSLVGSNYTVAMNGSFIKSTVNIYDYTDNSVLVFPLPPNLAEATEMGLQEMTSSLGRVASIVTLCGVGCLALLIGLNLLRRKSVIFLNR